MRWPTLYTARDRAVSRSPERGLSVDPHPFFPRSRSPAWACVGVSCRLRVAYWGGTGVSLSERLEMARSACEPWAASLSEED